MIQAKNRYLDEQTNINRNNYTNAKDCIEQDEADPNLLDSTKHMG